MSAEQVEQAIAHLRRGLETGHANEFSAAILWGVVIGCVISNGPLILYAVFGLLVWVWAMEHAARRRYRRGES